MRCPQFLLTTQKLPEVNVFMYESKCTSTTSTTAHPLSNIKL